MRVTLKVCALLTALCVLLPAAALGQKADDPTQVDVSIQQSLDRLRELELFSVRELVLNLPASATAFYNHPHPDDTEGWAAYHAEQARQAARLVKLADQAEDCNSGNCYVFVPSSADQAVSALNALQIVEVSGLVQAQPKNNSECYNLPCPLDQAAADAENHQRSVMVFTIAQYAKSNGI